MQIISVLAGEWSGDTTDTHLLGDVRLSSTIVPCSLFGFVHFINYSFLVYPFVIILPNGTTKLKRHFSLLRDNNWFFKFNQIKSILLVFSVKSCFPVSILITRFQIRRLDVILTNQVNLTVPRVLAPVCWRSDVTLTHRIPTLGAKP